MSQRSRDRVVSWSLSDRFRIHTLPQQLGAQDWGTLLQLWGKLINDYCYYTESTIERDIPYWYGERPLTGLLGAAAWMTPGGWSLEEFASMRGEGRGRGDLWLGIDSATYTIEAKITWPGKGTARQAYDDVLGQLKEASDQLRTLDSAYALGTCIAICYVVPAFPPSMSSGNDPLVNNFFNDLIGSFKGYNWIIASYRHPDPLADPEDSQKCVYPGVVLVGQAQSHTSKTENK